MPEIQPSIFNDTDDFMLPPRRALLPGWIIFFCWVFIVICPLGFLYTILQYSGTDLTMYGIAAKTDISFRETFSHANSVFTLVAVYGLLREKDWAINVAIINGSVSIADTLYASTEIMDGLTTGAEIGFFLTFYALTLMLSVIYLWKLFHIRKDWSIRLPRRAL